MESNTKSLHHRKQQQSPINYRRIFVICGIVFAFIFLFMLRNFLQSSMIENTVIQYQVEHTTHIKPQFLYNDNKTAFVFGATGIYSTTELFKCTSAIESLVKIGGWSGDVYLLIDDTTCLDPKLMASIPSANIHIIPFSGGSSRRRLRDLVHVNESSDSDLHRRKLMNAQPFERSMAIKTHILDFLKPNIEVAIWYDCDVIFAVPGCVKNMVNTPLPITKQKPFAIPFRYHVGTFAVKQNVSNNALLQWREKILGSNSNSALGSKMAIPDYEAFKQNFVELSDNGTIINEQFTFSPHAYHDVLITPGIMNGTVAEQTECVIHLTNGRCRHIPESRIQALLDGFHLESLKGKKWCPSLVRRKFKMFGWKWPFCWTPGGFA